MKTFIQYLEDKKEYTGEYEGRSGNPDYESFEEFLVRMRKDTDPKLRALYRTTTAWPRYNIMYHISPPERRESILQNGLDPIYTWGVSNFGERGIYMSNQRYPPKTKRMDVWEVNVRGLKLEMDPNDNSWLGLGEWPKKTPKRNYIFAWVYYKKIPPYRLKLVSKANIP